MKSNKICFLTDIHLAREGELANDVDTRSNFLSILKKIEDENPCHLIIGGDICYRESDDEVYKWVRKNLENLGIEYSCISGNHDDSSSLAKIIHPELEYNQETNELYYVKYIFGQKTIFLDTAAGEMSNVQWLWFEQQLKDKNHVFVVMHHPPIVCGVPHMDIKYAFGQMDKFQKVISTQQTGQVSIFTGHYHVERSLRHEYYDLFITPSSFVQIDDKYKEFVADHYVPAYRNIILGENGFYTSVRYLI